MTCEKCISVSYLEEYCKVSGYILLLTASLCLLVLIRDVASQEDVVIKASIKVLIPATGDCAPRVLDELPLGHLILDMGRGQVHRKEEQREAKDINRVHSHPETWIALTKTD